MKEIFVISIILFLLLSGCISTENEEKQQENNQEIIPLNELYEHAALYMGKQVTTIGFLEVYSSSPGNCLLWDDSSYYRYYSFRLGSAPSNLHTGWYLVNGTVGEGGMLGIYYLKIEVNYMEPI